MGAAQCHGGGTVPWGWNDAMGVERCHESGTMHRAPLIIAPPTAFNHTSNPPLIQPSIHPLPPPAVEQVAQAVEESGVAGCLPDARPHGVAV